MALETRSNSSGRYFYRKERHAGRVRSIYGGAGLFADMAHGLAESDRALTDYQRLRDRIAIKELALGEIVDRGAEAEARTIAQLALLAGGYHQHKGQWRRRRDMSSINMASVWRGAQEYIERQQSTQHAQAPVHPTGSSDFMELARRCNRADAAPQDVIALRKLLQESTQALGESLIRYALNNALVAVKTSCVPLIVESVADDTNRRRAELGYAIAPPLEKPLIDYLLLCELRLGQAEQVYTNAQQRDQSVVVAAAQERRLSATQKRYLRAVETLARVRRIRVTLAQIAPDGQGAAITLDTPGR